MCTSIHCLHGTWDLWLVYMSSLQLLYCCFYMGIWRQNYLCDGPDGQDHGSLQESFEAVVCHDEQGSTRYAAVLTGSAIVCCPASVSWSVCAVCMDVCSEATGQEAHNDRIRLGLELMQGQPPIWSPGTPCILLAAVCCCTSIYELYVWMNQILLKTVATFIWIHSPALFDSVLQAACSNPTSYDGVA
jgi:hypothetical protein